MRGKLSKEASYDHIQIRLNSDDNNDEKSSKESNFQHYYVGRLPMFSFGNMTTLDEKKFPQNVGLVIDFTAEFAEAPPVLFGRTYRCYPLLDAMYPSNEEELVNIALEAIHWNTERNGGVYIHCANGHGRSVMLMVVVLVVKGVATDIKDAISKIKLLRRGVHLQRGQLLTAQKLIQLLQSDSHSRLKTNNSRSPTTSPKSNHHHSNSPNSNVHSLSGPNVSAGSGSPSSTAGTGTTPFAEVSSSVASALTSLKAVVSNPGSKKEKP